LLPAFKKASNIDIKVVAVGTGQALDMGRRGDADVLFVHDQPAEEKFVAEGFGLKRSPVMYNDFVIVGPKADPVGVKGNDVAVALGKLAASSAPFISRADKSGTHAAELRYWRAAGIDSPVGKVSGYKECGCGMGPALNIGSSTDAYVLTDRGTWLNFKNRGNLAVLVEGDKRLFNQYGVIVVNPAKHPHVKKELAQAFADWVLSANGQDTIASYKINGEQLFFPNANEKN
jgi:tungstate transport system substrate-binding protein